MFTKGRYCGVTLSLRDMVVPKTLASFLERIAQGVDIRSLEQ